MTDIPWFLELPDSKHKTVIAKQRELEEAEATLTPDHPRLEVLKKELWTAERAEVFAKQAAHAMERLWIHSEDSHDPDEHRLLITQLFMEACSLGAYDDECDFASEIIEAFAQRRKRSDGGNARASKHRDKRRQIGEACELKQQEDPTLSQTRIAEIVTKKRGLGESPHTIRDNWRKYRKEHGL